MFRTSNLGSLIIFLLLLAQSQTVHAQGIIFPWSGPVNRSMGGAGTAAPLDAITAIRWNPAAMADLGSSELSTGIELKFPNLTTTSSIQGFGSGSSDADPGVIALPQIGWVHQTADPRVRFGLGAIAIGGAKTNYAASLTNPIFAPQSNSIATPGGFGSVYTEAQYLQIVPAISYVIDDRLSVGIGPTVTIAQVIFDPAVYAAPDDSDGSGVPRYASGRGGKFQWGGGFQFSAYFKARPDLSFGLSIKSPQWMEDLEVTGADELGLPRDLSVDVDLPMVVSLGTSLVIRPRTIFAADVRYIDHKNTDGYGQAGFNPDGSLAGLGYGNSYAVLAGIQTPIHPCVDMRFGYSFTSSPLSDAEATIGVFAPLYYQHTFATGCSVKLGQQTQLNVAYQYALDVDLTGPIITPAGPAPGSSVTTSANVHVGSFGVSVRY